ncbi:MAG: hypothetical protein BVN33_08615 [Proteobacteria bacterium ST_bin13]|nr:MAG: hypothetical protein BVN33_08615 [Proteobacteria bacterium ST_bin13]
MQTHLRKLLAYKAWANSLTYQAVALLPEGQAAAIRPTRWESIAYTLSHVAVVDDIFRCHLLGIGHDYCFRNIEERLSLPDLRAWQLTLDEWYVDHFAGLKGDAWEETVTFEFVGGGAGAMTKAEIVSHVVNHGTYHRGLVSDMLCHVPADMPANDLPVFLRDVWSAERLQPA